MTEGQPDPPEMDAEEAEFYGVECVECDAPAGRYCDPTCPDYRKPGDLK